MWVVKSQLKAALRTLDFAKADEKYNCPVLRKDIKGQEMRAAIGDNPERAYGTHGTDYLEVDFDTLAVRCGACSGELDSNVKE